MAQNAQPGSTNAQQSTALGRPLHFQDFPEVYLAGMRFTNTEEILRHERTPLVYLVKRTTIGWTVDIAIYNHRGFFLAKTSGLEVIGGIEAKKAGLAVDYHGQIAKCTLGGKVIWEIAADARHLRIGLSLHTPGGAHLEMPEPGAPPGRLLAPGITSPSDHVKSCRTGIFTRDDGTYELGVPH
jgi:hypothetical protein